MRLPEKEFRYEKAADLKYLHGSIKEVRNEAEDETVVQGAVKREHDRRREMPRGYFAVHLQALDEQRIQAEADRLSAALQEALSGNTGRPTHHSSPERGLQNCNDGQKIHHVLK